MSLVHTTLPDGSNANPPAVSPPMVLVIGDFEEDGDQIAWLLRISGYHAVLVPDVASAKTLLTHQHPSLIIAHARESATAEADDVVRWSGLECPGAAVILISDGGVHARSGVKSGIEGVLARPLDAGKFCTTVNRAMSRSAANGAG